MEGRINCRRCPISPTPELQHSHLGVDAQPSLSGTDDTNSRARPIQPQLHTIDAINAHDLAYRRTVAGGVTTTLVLPGSANNIGGEWSSRFALFFFLLGGEVSSSLPASSRSSDL